jgi:hypothetical protein
LGEVEKQCFEGSKRLANSFCLLVSPKRDLDEVERAMFQRIAGPCELIFCLLAGSKCDLGEVENGIFQRATGPCELIFCLLALPKCDLARSKKQRLKGVRNCPAKSFSDFWPSQNLTWTRSRKRGTIQLLAT